MRVLTRGFVSRFGGLRMNFPMVRAAPTHKTKGRGSQRWKPGEFISTTLLSAPSLHPALWEQTVMVRSFCHGRRAQPLYSPSVRQTAGNFHIEGASGLRSLSFSGFVWASFFARFPNLSITKTTSLRDIPLSL